MINQGKNVPDKTIVIFPAVPKDEFPYDKLELLIEKPQKTRDWFTPHFYRCLPLTIANQYGFVVKTTVGFSVIWDGSDGTDAITLEIDDGTIFAPSIFSHFGSGIFTLNFPFVLRTPPGVNLMTINPPNVVLPNITVLSGVVETDNLRHTFTFNFKVQIPNIKVYFEAGTDLAAILPVPRYFADSFSLKYAEEVFDKETIQEEYAAKNDSDLNRVKNQQSETADRLYLRGMDVYGNLFPDHQGA